MSTNFGRYAPSPSGDLHLGNLRTAVIAWLRSGGQLGLRIDDIDAQRSSLEVAQGQIADLEELGLRFVGPVVRQQEALDEYQAALQKLQDQGLVYECFCTRKDIQEASRAPHSIPGSYPGTCRNLTQEEAAAKRAELAEGGSKGGRVPALRLRADVMEWQVRELFSSEAVPAVGAPNGAVDSAGAGAGSESGEAVPAVGAPNGAGQQAARSCAELGGVYTGPVDDMVLRRGGNILPGCAPGEANDDGAGGHAHDYAYNLAVVVDDTLAGVREVVRGDDLLSSAPRQAYLAHLLDLPEVDYVHVPLVMGPTGKRLAKRDGAVTLRELREQDPLASVKVLDWILGSLNIGAAHVEAVDIGAADVEAVGIGTSDAATVDIGAAHVEAVGIGTSDAATAEIEAADMETAGLDAHGEDALGVVRQEIKERNQRVLDAALERFDLAKLPHETVQWAPDDCH